MEPVRLLRERGIEPHIYYVNPNIHPDEEYARRLDAIRAWTGAEHIAFQEGPRDVDAWEATAGRAGERARARFGVVFGPADEHAPAAEEARQARCRACYRLRFEESARFAVAHGYDALGTTLSVSPYQYTAIIREELERACENVGLRPFFEDYRPCYEQATRRSREAGMYRQNFCGCRFSDEEAALERAERKRERSEKRARLAAEHAAERAEEEAARAARRAERQAYAAKQARKKAALKALRESARKKEEVAPEVNREGAAEQTRTRTAPDPQACRESRDETATQHNRGKETSKTGETR